jgi:hypothetical protein
VLLDHVTIAGSNLEAMQRAFAGAGIPTIYGGAHANGITHMALAGFADGSYIELIAPVRRFEGGPGMMAGWGKFMAADAGVCAWAVRAKDIEGEVARLRGQGIEVHGPEPGGRKTVAGKDLQWLTATSGPGAAGAVLPFMIEDHTPREWRVPASPELQAAGLLGIAQVVIAVRELEPAVALLRRAYEWAEPEIEKQVGFGMRLRGARFAESPVLVVSAVGSAWERLERFGDCPVGVLVRAQSLESACSRLELSESGRWFGRRVAWVERCGAWVGVVE